ncbi:SERTA domain-containing protein 2-like isoform X1 [Arapaima gigas]
MWYMLGKGTKRKVDEDEDRVALETSSKLSYTLQRQTVLNLSLMKLYHQGAPAEPRLQKHVLVNNVLRRIQEEMRHEGSPQAFLLPPPSIPAQDKSLDEGFCEVLPLVATPVSLPPPCSPTSLDSCLTPASLLEEDPSPVPHTPLKMNPSSAKNGLSVVLDNVKEFCPVPSPAGLAPSLIYPVEVEPKDTDRSGGQRRRGCVPTVEAKGLEPVAPGGLDPFSSSFLADLALEDVLFADIDTSMYDFDLCISASGGTTSKMSVAMSADDLLRSLSPCGGSGGAPAGPNQPSKLDLSELDHIMEVLVGS